MKRTYVASFENALNPSCSSLMLVYLEDKDKGRVKTISFDRRLKFIHVPEVALMSMDVMGRALRAQICQKDFTSSAARSPTT